ncbi:MAG: hypothetical protein MHPSP_003319, partial [Paramarteilia canceri]
MEEGYIFKKIDNNSFTNKLDILTILGEHCIYNEQCTAKNENYIYQETLNRESIYSETGGTPSLLDTIYKESSQTSSEYHKL